MPNHKSAEKRDRQNERRKAINTAGRSKLRTQIKKLRSVLAEGDTTAAKTLLPETVSLIDKAARKGVLHQNAAARHKSRLTLRVNGMK
jgi:small subunit ribosomal protein S20